MKRIYFLVVLIVVHLCLLFPGCKKLIETSKPSTLILSSDIFHDSSLLIAAVTNIYTTLDFDGIFVPQLGLYIDELGTSNLSSSAAPYLSSIIPTLDNANHGIWNNYYNVIYQANAILAGLPSASGISASLLARVRGESEFLRAYCYFNMVNIWGGVPLITETNVSQTSPAPRSDTASIYAQVVRDLKDAQALLAESYAGEEKVRATKWAVTAMLARVYLFQKDWKDAVQQSASVINSGIFRLPDLSQAFLENNDETILQLWNQYGYTAYGESFIPYSPDEIPSYFLRPSFVSAFEPGDLRKINWLEANMVDTVTYYYPFKYKLNFTGSPQEFSNLLRLGEQYLIRAEALVMQGNIQDGLADINIVRRRARLSDINVHTAGEVMAALMKERRIELFCENGHRFFDLKRTGKIDSVMNALKSSWKTTARLFPIPAAEIKLNANLTQNPGYN